MDALAVLESEKAGAGTATAMVLVAVWVTWVLPSGAMTSSAAVFTSELVAYPAPTVTFTTTEPVAPPAKVPKGTERLLLPHACVGPPLIAYVLQVTPAGKLSERVALVTATEESLEYAKV